MDFRQTIVAAVCQAITQHIKLSPSSVQFTALLADTQGNAWARTFSEGCLVLDSSNQEKFGPQFLRGSLFGGNRCMTRCLVVNTRIM